ncbi:YlbF family regulator [Paraclostridium tenue]|uniref:YlbF family regulator n=1 Tax=Paraclostridium tenue TaxID=1737 RepID=A0ABP3X7A9_9FIRM
MNINEKAKELAFCIRSSNEFKSMNKAKKELDKNASLKKQFDEYVKKKNLIYSRYKIEDASKKISQLNREYDKFFNNPLVCNYMKSNRSFNTMMENLYKQIENELTK